jgi:hypothetical protein
VDNGNGRHAFRSTVAVMSAVVPVEFPGDPQVPVVPGYTLESRLGRGGSGEVWRAVPRRGGDPVAVKVLVAGDPARQAREAALLGALDHPHLVRLHEVVNQPRRDGEVRVALVLELLAGGSLAALLARRGRLRPGEVVTTIAPVAAALAHAHDKGVVHGDLSPGNIVFTAEGRPVLTDLGVARVLGETSAGEVTPAYVDPTVARGGAPGPASDVFGVAAAAFHALTGIAPWNAATPADVLEVAADGLLPDLAELAPEAPAELIAVVTRGLSADPHDRGSAAAFALDLRHACRPEPVGLPASGARDDEPPFTGRRPRTELTHQVPGRRPRPAPVIAGPVSRRELWRATLTDRWAERGGSLLRRTVAAGLVVTGLIAAGWLGVRWAGGDGESAPATAVAAATDERPQPSSRPPAEPDAAAVAADRQDAPGSTEAWRDVLATLYERRATAFAAASEEEFDGVYAPGSAQLAADRQHVQALAEAGETLRDFAPSVVEVTGVDAGGERVQVDLIDQWPDYTVDGPAGPHVAAGRAAAPVRMVLVRTADGWRIESAARLA